jgi:AcrR family transcriptional regulator
MPRPPELSPRKTPRQQRSRQMLERIIDAATRVLSERGYDGASTNRIAAEAGISSGSLYQYFPNKDAIVVAVLDRFADDLADRIGAQIEATMPEPWQTGGRALLDVQIALFEENADLLRIIVEQIPRLGPVDKLDSLRTRMSDLVRLYLILNRERFRPDLDIETAVWILAEVTGQLSVRYVLARPPIPRERMVEQLTALITRYIGR